MLTGRPTYPLAATLSLDIVVLELRLKKGYNNWIPQRTWRVIDRMGSWEERGEEEQKKKKKEKRRRSREGHRNIAEEEETWEEGRVLTASREGYIILKGCNLSLSTVTFFKIHPRKCTIALHNPQILTSTWSLDFFDSTICYYSANISTITTQKETW